MHRFTAALFGALALLVLFVLPAQAVPSIPETATEFHWQMGKALEGAPRPAKTEQKTTEQQVQQLQQPASVLQPPPSRPRDEGVVRYLFESDQTLTMPKNSVSHYFFTPRSMTLSGTCQIKLHVTYSQTMIDELSSLTLFINGTPIATRAIVEEGTLSFDWDVLFTSSLVRLGDLNEIKFLAVQRSIDGECIDTENSSNWVVLQKDSYLYMRMSPATNPPLSDFLHLYYDAFAEPFTIANDYILSNPTDADMLEAMLGMASAAGMFYPGKSQLRIGVFANSALLASNANEIYIEKVLQPSVGLLLSPPNPALTPGEGYLAFAGVNDRKPFYTLLVGARDAEGLRKATDFLASNTLLSRVQDASIRLRSAFQRDLGKEQPAKADTLCSLFDLGYSHIKLMGTFNQRTTLSFLQRNGIKSATGSYVDIHFRHAAALLSDRSQLTISINGTQMDSVKLLPSNVQGANLRVYFPESVLDLPVINVDIEVYHYLGKVDCTKEYNDVAWTVIDTEKSTVFFKQGKAALRPTLNGFPYFNSTGSNAQVAIVLTPDSVQTAALLAARAGQNTKVGISWRVQNSKAVEKALLSESDLVFLADKRDAVLPKEISDELAIIVQDGNFVIQDETLDMIPEVLAGKAVVQALRSPWNFYRTAYILLYDGEQGLSKLNELFAKRDYLNRMSGQLCLVDQNAQVQSFVIEPRSLQEEELPKTVETYIREAEAITGLPIWATASIAVLLLLLVLKIVRLSRRKQDEFKHAVDQLMRSQKGPQKVTVGEPGMVKASDPNVWTCSCGATGNTGKFCSECGERG